MQKPKLTPLRRTEEAIHGAAHFAVQGGQLAQRSLVGGTELIRKHEVWGRSKDLCQLSSAAVYSADAC